jgi:hypothetical protein
MIEGTTGVSFDTVTKQIILREGVTSGEIKVEGQVLNPDGTIIKNEQTIEIVYK